MRCSTKCMVVILLFIALFLLACAPQPTGEELNAVLEDDPPVAGQAYYQDLEPTQPECFSCAAGKLLVGTTNNIGGFSSPAAIFLGKAGSSSSPIVLASGGSGVNGGAVVGDAVRATFVHPEEDGSF